MRKIILVTIIVLPGFTAYLFLFGKLFPYSPIILGFTKQELNNTIIYIQNGAEFNDYVKIDTLISSIEKFHELKFIKKPELFIFQDSISYIHHSPSKARFCAFPDNRLFITPWALREVIQGKISLEIYVKHELSHVLIFQHEGILAKLLYPNWLLEGIAVYSSNQMGATFYPTKSETYHAIAQGNFMPPNNFKTKKEEQIILNVKYRQTFMYSEFACIVDYMITNYGKEKFLAYMKGLLNNNDKNNLFKQIYGLDFEKLLIDFKIFVLENDRIK
jgi:hypothetical protein